MKVTNSNNEIKEKKQAMTVNKKYTNKMKYHKCYHNIHSDASLLSSQGINEWTALQKSMSLC